MSVRHITTKPITLDCFISQSGWTVYEKNDKTTIITDSKNNYVHLKTLFSGVLLTRYGLNNADDLIDQFEMELYP